MNRKYKHVVLKWAITVPRGIEKVGFLRSAEELEPANIQVQALKKRAKSSGKSDTLYSGQKLELKLEPSRPVNPGIFSFNSNPLLFDENNPINIENIEMNTNTIIIKPVLLRILTLNKLHTIKRINTIKAYNLSANPYGPSLRPEHNIKVSTAPNIFNDAEKVVAK